ncbi:MAG: transcriptional initiation protein Tat [Proteobacteria bacterium]|nr:MAG: transcriptional initiation protein Tat [Pseudomonadota bacterium]
MLPRSARAQAAAAVKRFVAWYVPNGIEMAGWTPAATGADYALTPILQPLASLRSEVLVLSGLANLPARDTVPGDHARGTGGFLTARNVRRTDGADIQNGISLDQRIAQFVGGTTTLPSLQLGAESGGSTGNCDSGYSCAYARNISWAGPQTPLAKETDPASAFERLFQGTDTSLSAEERERRRVERLSVLDAVAEDALRLRAELGGDDRHKLDEYLTGVRELELRVRSASGGSCDAAQPADPDDFRTRVRAMADLIVLALRCDATRVVTFMQANAGSNQTFPWLGVLDGHHQVSHHQSNAANLAALRAIDTWEIEELAYLLQQLDATAEPTGGTLLDSSIVFFSSEIEDGDRHRHTNLPVLVAGRGGGALAPGRHVRFAANTPIANLFLAFVRAFGVQDATFGADGTSPLTI